MSQSSGTLYVVATPIGNLGDMTFRALDTLKSVDLIAAEDTRHSSRLLQHFDIRTPAIAYHDHNEEQCSQGLIEKLLEGKNIALISDAGTPLISDPGHRLICQARDHQITVVPLPGACAFVVGLSGAGIPVDRFLFEGFLPAKQHARRQLLSELINEERTLIFYESPHRIVETLQDCALVLGGGRVAVLARELTKLHESWYRGSLAELSEMAASAQLKGEMVLMVSGVAKRQAAVTELQSMLTALLEEVTLKQAVEITRRLTGEKKNRVYTVAVEIQQARLGIDTK